MLWKHLTNRHIVVPPRKIFYDFGKWTSYQYWDENLLNSKSSQVVKMRYWSLRFPNVFFFFPSSEHHHHHGFIGNSQKDVHAECTCSAFRPFAGVLPHHLQGVTIQPSANFDLITASFTEEPLLYWMRCASNWSLSIKQTFQGSHFSLLFSKLA